MPKQALVIRSVSFQQLDKNLVAIRERFPAGDFQLHLLTHGHGIERARTYSAIVETIDYGSKKNFSVFHLPGALRGKKRNRYDAVIVPVTNKTGAGFLNVLVMTLRIETPRVYICNLTSEIWDVPRRKICLKAVTAVFFSIVSALLTLPGMVIATPVLLGFALFRKKGR